MLTTHLRGFFPTTVTAGNKPKKYINIVLKQCQIRSYLFVKKDKNIVDKIDKTRYNSL